MKTIFNFFLGFLFCSVLNLCEAKQPVAYGTLPNLEVEVLNWSPRIFLYRHFLSPEECDYLKAYAEPYLTRSTVVDNDSQNPLVIDGRTSEGMFFPDHHGDPIITQIEDRIALLTMISKRNGENIQVLRYQEGGEYLPHYDWFDQQTVGGGYHMLRGGQRVASFLMYLNAPEEGGETIFPMLGIEVKPEKGTALLFYDCRLDGTVDPFTLHGGAPVIKGQKWLATKWLRQGHF